MQIAPNMIFTAKFVVFLALIAVYWVSGGFGSSANHTMQRLHNTITVVYIMGAIIAVWLGDKTIGTLQPVSLRPIFILFGSLLMIAAFCAMLAVRSEKVGNKPAPNHSIQQTEASRLAINQIQPQRRLAPAADTDR